MFGLEFSDCKPHHSFPKYNIAEAVSPEDINTISPLVWQEHCVECAMPECYHTCAHYKRRSDGRCRLFKYGIERFKNKDAILGQNVVIEMDEWAKLETFFFTSGFPIKKGKAINNVVVFMGNLAQIFHLGGVRRFFYNLKELFIRSIGDRNQNTSMFFCVKYLMKAIIIF